MFNNAAIYTVHKNEWKNDPADRVVLVREGFAFWAFVFAPLWLLAHRLWLPALGYVAVVAAIHQGGAQLHVPLATLVMLQLGVQVWLGFNARDMQRWGLARRGYRETGVIAAESALMAEHRVLENA